ncbi:MAG: hypothetical protein M1835_006664 [Candelina submexicana]|nr:MAG: hypothetical protein M1835_006664 [Candelina submexicana]
MVYVIRQHKTELNKIPFPKKVREGARAEEPCDPTPYGFLLGFFNRLDKLFRERALEWKAEGREGAVENTVKPCNGVIKAAEALDKDPEADVGLWQF